MKPSILLAALIGLTARLEASGVESGDPVNGAKIFTACAACHATATPDHQGPALRGVVGRPAGTLPGFRYSRALKNARRVWSEATLDAYLADPQAALPGNAMPYPGLPDPAPRRH
jgi:cytochrome c